MRIFVLVLLCVILDRSVAFAQYADYKVVVTSQGYTSINRYAPSEFSEALVQDFKPVGEVVIRDHAHTKGQSKVNIMIGQRIYNFQVSAEMPVVRLTYDRNRRVFTGAGCNFIEDSTVVYKAPTFKGMNLVDLPSQWTPEINKLITDKNLLSAHEPTLFLLEADIDENGIVHKIVELNGTLRQYSKVIIDQIYEKAVRGWEPATRNGKSYRTLAQIQLYLSRGDDK